MVGHPSTFRWLSVMGNGWALKYHTLGSGTEKHKRLNKLLHTHWAMGMARVVSRTQAMACGFSRETLGAWFPNATSIKKMRVFGPAILLGSRYFSSMISVHAVMWIQKAWHYKQLARRTECIQAFRYQWIQAELHSMPLQKRQLFGSQPGSLRLEMGMKVHARRDSSYIDPALPFRGGSPIPRVYRCV